MALTGLPANKIILSCKTSDIASLVDIYRELSKTDYPLHLGLTEAGMGKDGMIASTSALSILLYEGIGDTIRVSLTPESDEDRVMKFCLQGNFIIIKSKKI